MLRIRRASPPGVTILGMTIVALACVPLALAAVPTGFDAAPSPSIGGAADPAGAATQRVEITAAPAAPSASRDEYVTGAPDLPSQVAGLGAISLPASEALSWPVVDATRISSPFGERDAPCGGCSTFHDGVDYTPREGTPVLSIAGGTVTVAAEGTPGLGTLIEIQHNIEGRLLTSSYAHLESGSPQVVVGDQVAAGQLIARVGSTGQSTGPHLHLELYAADGVRIDGDAWLAARLAR
jgi:murein DD-endopeptidase MepM/ murein hydrolase activator NlpD